MKYRLLKTLVDVAPGVIFEWDEKRKMYAHSDWTLTRDLVEKSPEWFEEVNAANEAQKVG